MGMETHKFTLLTLSAFTEAQRMKQRLRIEISLPCEVKIQCLWTVTAF